MAREQVNYEPSPVTLGTSVTPNYQSVATASAEDITGTNTGAMRLAESLKSSAVTTAAANVKEGIDKRAETDASLYNSTHSVGDIGKAIKEGTLPTSLSPVFQASVNHYWGENVQRKMERETLDNISSGKLNLTNEELYDHMDQQRTELLSGSASSNVYALAGFNKGWNSFQDSALSSNFKRINKEAVDNAGAIAEESLSGLVSSIQDPNYKGDKPQGAQQLIDQFNVLSGTHVIQHEDRGRVLASMLHKVAESGDIELLNHLKSGKLSDGLTVNGVVGMTGISQLDAYVKAQDQTKQIKRVDGESLQWFDLGDQASLHGKKLTQFNNWAEANKDWVHTSTIRTILGNQESSVNKINTSLERQQLDRHIFNITSQNKQAVDMAIKAGVFSQLPQLIGANHSGGEENFKQKEYAVQSINQVIHANGWDKDQAGADKAMGLWTSNGVENPVYKNVIQSGVSNIASVGVPMEGKKMGELNAAGKTAFELYNQIYRTNPSEAAKYAGADAQMYEDVQFLRSPEGNSLSLDQAATMVNEGRNSGISSSDYGNTKKAIATALTAVVDETVYNNLTTWFGDTNTSVNTTTMNSVIARRTELLMRSGKTSDVAGAIEKVTKDLMGSEGVVKINNTMYFKKDLPQLPKDLGGFDIIQGMTSFIADVPATASTKMGLNGSQIRLAKNTQGGYTAMNVNTFLHDEHGDTVTYTDKQIIDWMYKNKEKVTQEALAHRYSVTKQPTTINTGMMNIDIPQ